MIRLTKKHRVTIRNICPLNPLLPILHFHGQDYVNAVAAALNAIASEPEEVTVARERLMRAVDAVGSSTRWDDSLTTLHAAACAYVNAVNDARDLARRAKRARK
jgi:hypothetical protein